MRKKIKVGDTVLWRGNFGSEPAKPVKVESIEINCKGKEGDPVDSVDYPSYGLDTSVIFTLDNGHWAYGDQIKPKR